MGYTTRFTGSVKLSRPLTFAEAKQLLEANEDPDVIDGLRPGSYMQWVPTETLDQIVWDGGEKFYYYAEWLQWLCSLLATWQVEADGAVKWFGEKAGDVGELIVIQNSVTQHDKTCRADSSPRPLTLAGLRVMALEKLST